MSLIESLLLGVLQGLTEFLPVSSSGHLLLLQNFFSSEKENILLDVVAHGGTFLSILTFYYEDIKKSLKDFSFWGFVFLSNVMTALFVLPFQSYLEAFFYQKASYFLALSFFVTALILLTSRKSYLEKKNLTFMHTLSIGLVQGIAVIPGLSRSGLTICTGLFLGLSRKEASFFSFMIALPALLGAVLLQSIQLSSKVFLSWPLLVTFLSSYIVGLIALKFLVRFIEKGKLHIFSVYLFILAGFLIIKNLIN